MGLFSEDKPYTAVSAYIDKYSGDEYDTDSLVGIPELCEVINIQPGGPTEAARSIRKKLKYGNAHRQLRALTILDALVENAGQRFQRQFADEMLLDRLRFMAQDRFLDPEVKKRVFVLFTQWKEEFEGQKGMTSIALLHQELPRKTRRPPTVRPPTPDADEDIPGAASAPSSPRPAQTERHRRTASTEESRESRPRSNPRRVVIPLSKELPQIRETLAEANQASTVLSNALKHVDRERRLPSQDPKIVQYQKHARQIRRKVLRYIQIMEAEEWLGTLLHANEELVSALQMYEIMDRPIDEDSDSDFESVAQNLSAAHIHSPARVPSDESEEAPRKPSRPMHVPIPAPAQDDPFGDDYGVATPAVEKGKLDEL